MAITPTVRINVSGARGASFGDVARQTGAYDVEPSDNDNTVLNKFADFAIAENPGFKGDKGDPGSPGEGYATRSALATAGNSATGGDDAYLTEAGREGKFVFRTGNWSVGVTADPGQGVIIAKASDTTGATGAWFRQFDGPVKPEWFGAVGDDVTIDRTAFMNAKSYLTWAGGEMLLAAATTYYLGTTLTSLDGIAIVPEKGAMLRGNWNRKASYVAKAELTTQLKDTENDYLPLVESTKYRRSIADKEVFFDGIEPDRSEHVAIDCTTLTVYQVAWPAGDTWSTISGESADERTLILTLPSGNWRAGLIPATGGDELSCKQASGNYQHAAIIRTTNGYYVFFTPDQTSDAEIWYKPIGGAAVKVTDLDWTGRADHDFWQPGNANWTIRLYDLTTFSIMLNGLEIFGPYTIAAGAISFYGFGGKVAAPVTQAFYDWVLVRGKEVGGKGIHFLVTAGDSRVADIHGDWPTYCRELLEHSDGYSVVKLDNIAQDGATSAVCLATVTAHDFTGVTDFVVGIGTNDVQNSVDLATSMSNVEAIIDHVQGLNIRVTLVLPQDFYPKALTDNTGVITFNEAFQPMYRQAIHRIAADRGCQVVDLTQVLKPVYAYEANPPVAAPWFEGSYLTGLRDNIHNGQLQYRKIAWSVARAMLGAWPRKRQGFDLAAMPSVLFDNSWTSAAGNDAALWQVSEDGILTITGSAVPGTKTDLTVIARLPFNVSPRAVRQFPCYGNNGTLARIIVDGTDIKVVGFSGGSDTLLHFNIALPIR